MSINCVKLSVNFYDYEKCVKEINLSPMFDTHKSIIKNFKKEKIDFDNFWIWTWTEKHFAVNRQQSKIWFYCEKQLFTRLSLDSIQFSYFNSFFFSDRRQHTKNGSSFFRLPFTWNFSNFNNYFLTLSTVYFSTWMKSICIVA